VIEYVPPQKDVALPESPDIGWRIVKAEPVHQTGRWHKNSMRMLQLIMEHKKDNGEYVTIEVMVDATYKLAELVPFLKAAENLPDGIRIKLYTAERVPWDRRPDRR
jgi:hypothetical protein